MNTLLKKLRGSHVLIITHVYGTGPSQDLEQYLKGLVASLVFIGHPFSYAADRRSFWRRYVRGKIVAEGRSINWRSPEVVFYIKDAFLTLYWGMRHGEPYDLVIGAGGFNAVLGLVLGLTGRAKKVVFYCIDWMPQRFSNQLLNKLYHLLDRLAVTYTDCTWNLSTRMAEVRQQRGIVATQKQITVPVGIWLQRFPSKAKPATVCPAVMYMGHVRAGQGLSLIIRAWPLIVNRCPTATLHIVGDGPLKQQLQAQISTTTVADSVIWHGFVPDHRQVEAQLVRGDLAVAMYEPGTFTRYTDPGKLKVYLAAGLPIIMTNIGPMAIIIKKYQAGKVIAYEQTALVESISELLADDERRAVMQAAAKRLAAEYDWEILFPQALKQTL